MLPGLDTDLEDKAWQSIGGSEDGAPLSSHPQFALHALLARFGIARKDVKQLDEDAPRGREVLASEVMRPASAQRAMAYPPYRTGDCRADRSGH